jgi:hypothetical protein
MNADQRRYKHQSLTRGIIGVFFEVYNELGHGFLESIYREAMCIALREQGFQVMPEYPPGGPLQGPNHRQISG